MTMDNNRRNTPILSIQELIQELKEIQIGYNVLSILERCNIPMKDWSRFAYYKNSESYSRNLIYQKDKQFQLLLICWQPGQGNKPEAEKNLESECYFKVLDGHISERKYESSSEGEAIKLKSKKMYYKGDVCESGRIHGYHRVTNESKESMAVTLHVYINTTAVNKLYNTEDQTTEQKAFSSFISNNGKPIGDCQRLDRGRCSKQQTETRHPGNIEKLLKKLNEIKNRDQVVDILQRCQLSKEDWSKYVFWKDSEDYSRNLIYEESDKFQVIITCWQPGKGNQSHGHLNSDCYSKVLVGELCETQYNSDNTWKSDKIYKENEVYERGDVKDHSLRNVSLSTMALSLHVYIKPTFLNKVYDAVEKTAHFEILHFTSKSGKPIVAGCKSWSSMVGFSVDDSLLKKHNENILQTIGCYVRQALLVMSILALGLSLVAITLVIMTRVGNSNQHDVSSILLNDCRQYKSLPVSAYKTFSHATSHNEADDNHMKSDTVLNIDPNFNSPSEHARGVNLLSDGLVIAYPGKYHVYINILFQNFEMLSNRSKLRVDVYKESTKKVFLRKFITIDNSGAVKIEPVYIGGNFYFQNGDLIKIYLSAPNFTYFDKDESYIGVTLLSNN